MINQKYKIIFNKWDRPIKGKERKVVKHTICKYIYTYNERERERGLKINIKKSH